MQNNPFLLTGKNILVTGASSGIGKSTALACGRFGANLFITGRNEKRLNQTLELFDRQEDVTSIRGDLTDIKFRDKLINTTESLDGLVMNAGIIKMLPLKFMSDEEIDRMYNINFMAQVKLLRDLVKKRKVKKGASIIFITSISGGVVGHKAHGLYGSTKAALTGLAQALAIDMGRQKIRVNCIAPGMIVTEGVEDFMTTTVTKEDIAKDKKEYPLGDYGEPDDVAYAAIYLLSQASKWVTGTTLILDGGFTAK